jgi:hypothetical protein
VGIWSTSEHGTSPIDPVDFQQANGPTVMTANPYVTENRISAGALVLGPVVDGYRHGTVTVTMAHRWGTKPDHLKRVKWPAAMTPASRGPRPTSPADVVVAHAVTECLREAGGSPWFAVG